jgi:hypothetical protein
MLDFFFLFFAWVVGQFTEDKPFSLAVVSLSLSLSSLFLSPPFPGVATKKVVVESEKG